MSDHDDTGHYQGVLLEEVRDDIKRLAEAMSDVPGDVRHLKDDMSEVKTRLTTVGVAITDLSKHHAGLDGRVTILEQN